MSVTHIPINESDDDGRESELAKIKLWRLQCFLECGFEESAAMLLAESDADVHFIKERLLDRGCSLETALEIAA